MEKDRRREQEKIKWDALKQEVKQRSTLKKKRKKKEAKSTTMIPLLYHPAH